MGEGKYKEWGEARGRDCKRARSMALVSEGYAHHLDCSNGFGGTHILTYIKTYKIVCFTYVFAMCQLFLS